MIDISTDEGKVTDFHPSNTVPTERLVDSHPHPIISNLTGQNKYVNK